MAQVARLFFKEMLRGGPASLGTSFSGFLGMGIFLTSRDFVWKVGNAAGWLDSDGRNGLGADV
jgi:hypothetical protein